MCRDYLRRKESPVDKLPPSISVRWWRRGGGSALGTYKSRGILCHCQCSCHCAHCLSAVHLSDRKSTLYSICSTGHSPLVALCAACGSESRFTFLLVVSHSTATERRRRSKVKQARKLAAVASGSSWMDEGKSFRRLSCQRSNIINDVHLFEAVVCHPNRPTNQPTNLPTAKACRSAEASFRSFSQRRFSHARLHVA